MACAFPPQVFTNDWHFEDDPNPESALSSNRIGWPITFVAGEPDKIAIPLPWPSIWGTYMDSNNKKAPKKFPFSIKFANNLGRWERTNAIATNREMKGKVFC